MTIYIIQQLPEEDIEHIMCSIDGLIQHAKTRLEKNGSQDCLQQLYRELDGRFLISNCKTSLIVEANLLKLDDFFVPSKEVLSHGLQV